MFARVTALPARRRDRQSRSRIMSTAGLGRFASAISRRFLPISINRLYLAKRPSATAIPVLMYARFTAIRGSAMVTSSVSPERCETDTA